MFGASALVMYCADSADSGQDVKVKVRLVDFQKCMLLADDDPDYDNLDVNTLNGV